MTRLGSALLVTVLSIGLAGCGMDDYEMEMRVEGDELVRTLTFRVADADRPSEEVRARLAPIERAYGSAGVRFEDTYRFEGRFRDRTPADLGGQGYLLRYASPWGDLRIYSERLGPQGDVDAAIQRSREASRTLADLIARWFERDLGPLPDREGVLARLREVLSHDLPDLTGRWLLLSQGGEQPRTSGKEEHPDGAALLEHRLAELGWIEPVDLPALSRPWGPAGPGGDGTLLRRGLARRLGLPTDPLPAALDFLAPERAAEAFDSFRRADPEFAAVVERMRPRLPADAADASKEAFVLLLGDAVGGLQGPTWRVAVRLQLPEEP